MPLELKGKSVLVTGGAGFIGSHLVDRLICEEPGNLVVVDNFFLGREDNLAAARAAFPALKVYRLDASDLAAMHQFVQAENDRGGVRPGSDSARPPLCNIRFGR